MLGVDHRSGLANPRRHPRMGLKSFADYLASRRSDMRVYNKAIFFILRAWKILMDYDRGTDYFRKKKPAPEKFEAWRAILAKNFVDNFGESPDTVSEAVRILSEADPAMATRLDNSIRRILSTFPLSSITTFGV